MTPTFLSPTAALESWAEREPEQPWLFFPHGLDLRWISWREGAARVRRLARQLAALDLPPGGSGERGRLGFAYRPDPPSVLLDLAVQTIGRISVPLPADLPPQRLRELALERGCQAWLETKGEREGVESDPKMPRFQVDLSSLDGSDRAGSGKPWGTEAGGAVTSDGQEWSAERLAAAGQLLAAALAGAPTPRGRDILVSWRDLDHPVERQVVSWTLAAGAALILEPQAGSGLASALWARPTVFGGLPEEMEAFHVALDAKRGWLHRLRPGRLPLGRLRAVLWLGPAPPPAGEAERWSARGVSLVVYPLAESTPSTSGVDFPL